MNAPVTCVIQARVRSQRLPSKVLKPLHGKAMIEHVLTRVKRSKKVNNIILATGTDPANRPLEKIAHKNKVLFFAGNENDVLDRYYQALQQHKLDRGLVVRVTGDCPLIDPEIIDQVIGAYDAAKAEYVSNVQPPTFPDGLDVEVFSFDTLKKAWQMAKTPMDREHVTLFIRQSGKFKIKNVRHSEDLSSERWTVDNEEDFAVVERIVAELEKKKPEFGMRDVLKLKTNLPEIFEMNRHIARNEGLKKSVEDWKASVKSKYRKNQELLKKARRVTPLGAQTYSRSFRYFSEGASPAFTERGKGSRVWDVDGNEFIDFILSLGAVTLGYNNEEVNRAIIDQLAKGITFSQPSPVSVRLAEKITQIIPSAEMVRFVKNGSDATSAAIRLARAFTKRDTVVACGYHGWQDWYIASTSNHRGIPKGVLKYTLSCAYNDLKSLSKIFTAKKGQIAAVIMEPVQGNGPASGYLEAVKKLCQKNKALLIFDEVVSGFRMGIAGGQGYYKVTPDLSAFGKGMGNGMPISCVAGKREILSQIEGGVFISTTFGDETLSLAAALKVIEILQRPGAFEHIWALGDRWLKGVEAHIRSKGLTKHAQILGLAPHCGIAFTGTKELTSHDLQSVYQQKLLERGILTLGINNFCLAHTRQEVQAYIDAVGEALDDVKRALELKSVEEMLAGEKVTPIFKRN